MPIKGSALVILILLATVSFFSIAQTGNQVSGQVVDSTAQAISPAYVLLISGQDTLRTSTDDMGKFEFSAIKTIHFQLIVRSLGYQPFLGSYTFIDKGDAMTLAPLVLKVQFIVLDDVVILSKVNPVSIKKDTIEYNAAAYLVRKNDRLKDLIRQLPGMKVDGNGTVTSLGQTLTKIRVNGKDFFTGNVSEFINQLPAGLVRKIQVVDDYGDHAAFTGVKTGLQPTKILNVVTKTERLQGILGQAKADLGSNELYGLEGNANLMKATEQISVNSRFSRANNGAGKSSNRGAGLFYRKELRKTLSGSGSYQYSGSGADSRQQSYTETINGSGTIFANMQQEASQNNNNHQIDLGLEHRGIVNSSSTSIIGSLARSRTVSLSMLSQKGLVRQDMITNSSAKGNNPNVQANSMFSHRFKKAQKSMFIRLTAGTFSGSSNNYLDDLISYYDPATGRLVKDSLVNRLTDEQSRSENLGLQINYNEPLGGPAAGIRKILVFSYTNSINTRSNNFLTNIQNDTGVFLPFDSLSSRYTSLSRSQALQLTYGFNGKQLFYTFGFSAQANAMNGKLAEIKERVKSRNLNLLPVLSINFRSSQNQTFSLVYSGKSRSPELNQLQPVPDTRNLQNIKFGNPKLKFYSSHNAMLNYNRIAENGSALQLAINAGTIQNKVVTNTLLMPDTLNSLRQETRFLNANGNYSFGANYSWSMPFANKRHNLELLGNLGYSGDVFFAENQENFSKGLNFSQALNYRTGNKWLTMNAGCTYSFNANRYTLGTTPARDIKTWLFNADARFILGKGFSSGLQAMKIINEGYAFQQANPLLINFDIEKLLFKKEQGSIKLQAFDLLNQGNNLKRTSTGNTITDTRTNQIRRYFQLSLLMGLNQFG